MTTGSQNAWGVGTRRAGVGHAAARTFCGATAWCIIFTGRRWLRSHFNLINLSKQALASINPQRTVKRAHCLVIGQALGIGPAGDEVEAATRWSDIHQGHPAHDADVAVVEGRVHVRLILMEFCHLGSLTELASKNRKSICHLRQLHIRIYTKFRILHRSYYYSAVN